MPECPFQLQIGEDGQNGLAAVSVLEPALAPLGPLVAQHPGRSARAQAEDGEIERAAPGDMGVEDRAASEEAYVSKIQASGVDASQGHSAGDRVAEAVNHAAGGLRVTFGRKAHPLTVGEVRWKKLGGSRLAVKSGKAEP